MYDWRTRSFLAKEFYRTGGKSSKHSVVYRGERFVSISLSIS